MTIRTDRREAAIERMADHLLAEGLEAATLRPLAAAAGTSDRMLLYYFVDREELLSATLKRIGDRMNAQLDTLVPLGRRSFPQLLAEFWAALESEDFKPFMQIWLDLAAGASRGLQPHRDVAGTIFDEFHAWVANRLEEPQEVASPRATAALFLAAVNGMHLLETIGRGSIAEIAVAELAAISHPEAP